MDFDDTPEEAAFRAEARSWLAAHAQPRTGELHRRTLAGDPGAVKAARAWQRTRYDGGWTGITWPKAYGGLELTAVQESIFNQEQLGFEVSSGTFTVAVGMVGPTIIAHGRDDQKARFLDPILRGDEVWCQLFSEPGAGSDLAALATRAVRDGDEWVVNGQKVWTSGAHHSQWGILLARTDPDVRKHAGMTYFLVDMSTPGIDVRPLRQINGASHFNEVFLTDVRIPHEHVLGEVDGGWGVAMTTLANERTAIGGGSSGTGWADLAALAATTGAGTDPLARQGLAEAYTRMQILRFLGYRVQTALSHGQVPGPESSVIKLFLSQHSALMGDLVLALEGADGMLTGDWSTAFLGQWAVRIGGGTDQIQRNVIGERVLGLPAEPRLDKQVAFRDLPR